MKNSFFIVFGATVALLVSIIFFRFIGISNTQVELEPTPALPMKACDTNNQCPFGQGACYKFEDEEKPVCWTGGNPCNKCLSKQCEVLESYPMQVKCK